MCGIVGLFLKDRALEPRFGSLFADMLGVLSDRGPDSAGFAIYADGAPDTVKLTVRLREGDDPAALARALEPAAGGTVTARIQGSHAVLLAPAAREAEVVAALAARTPPVALVSRGLRMEVCKEVGRPTAVTASFGLERMAGSHGIGHTRMATESAVTTEGAHPFSTGRDQCLVHNGSLSNHNAVRRELRGAGLTFETDNDSEVAAGYLSWRISRGATLADALQGAVGDLDGFYTFVVGTESGFAVLRDPIACKPAVMAETDGYVAFGSEYRALAGLPGIAAARVWEPEPGRVYFWERAA